MPFDALLLQIPEWLLILILILLFSGFSALGLLLVRKYIPHTVLKLHNDVAGFIFATLGVIYAVLLAFVVLVVWEQFNSAREASEMEASYAFALYRDISMYPDSAAADVLRKEFREYVVSVVHSEYPSLAKLQIDTVTIVRFRELFYSFQRNLSPKTFQEVAGYGEIMKNLNLVAEKRALRMMGVRSSIPAPIWFTLLLGGFLTIGFTFLFGTENFKAQLIMSVSLSILIAMITFVMLELQYPYSGNLSIQPEGYKVILEWSPLKVSGDKTNTNPSVQH